VVFTISQTDNRLIERIVERAMRLAGRGLFNKLQLTMDLTACHCNGCELRLLELLEADAFNFAHDVAGISRNMDRTTGELKNCFLPRFSA
jgi:hypothetical protein